MQVPSHRAGADQPPLQIEPLAPRSSPSHAGRVRSIILATIVSRLREEGRDILQRVGIKPGPEQALPSEHRFRITIQTAKVWEARAKFIRRIATAVAVVAILALALRLAMILAASAWAIWKIAGLTAAIVALVARHAELQLRAQHQRESQPGAVPPSQEPAGSAVEQESARLEAPAVFEAAQRLGSE
jgi:hypothetical protein